MPDAETFSSDPTVSDGHDRRRIPQAETVFCRRGANEGEALSFLFENFDSMTDAETFGHRLELFCAALDGRKT